MDRIEYVKPEDIEGRSFSLISQQLDLMGIRLPEATAMITKRTIHTTADFEYAHTMRYSKDAEKILAGLIREGAHIVTDTNMAKTGINKTELGKYGGEAHCFMADEEIAKIARERNVTRASVSMEKALEMEHKLIFVVGNAPTALVALYEAMEKGLRKPEFVIGVPVGFVNVVASKELFLDGDIPYIINQGRKGGSNVAACIINAVLYEMRKGAL